MAAMKKCRHGRGLTGHKRREAWRRCGCQWMVSVTVDGRRTYVTLGVDETEAEANALRLRADTIDGRAVRRHPGKGFDEVAASYMRVVRTAPGARPNNVRTVESRLRRVTAWWGDVPVDSVTIEQVRRFLDQAADRWAPNTVIGLYSQFRAVMAHAQDHGLVGALPLPARSRLRKVNQRQANHLTWQECYQVIGALAEPYRTMAELALLTGLRVGELTALDGAAVDLAGGRLHVVGTLHHDGSVGPPKTQNGRRVVTLSARAVELLDGRCQGGRVFPVASLAMCGHVMRDALRDVGLYRKGRGWHAFRHSHEALLEQVGVGIRDAAARLGHGPNFAQTAAYGWAAEATDVDDLDAVLVRLRHSSTSSGEQRSG